MSTRGIHIDSFVLGRVSAMHESGESFSDDFTNAQSHHERSSRLVLDQDIARLQLETCCFMLQMVIEASWSHCL